MRRLPIIACAVLPAFAVTHPGGLGGHPCVRTAAADVGGAAVTRLNSGVVAPQRP